MATTSASATNGNDGVRATYARTFDAGSDSNRFRIDNIELSAFDLLLSLPVFDSQPAAEIPGDDEESTEASDENRIDEPDKPNASPPDEPATSRDKVTLLTPAPTPIVVSATIRSDQSALIRSEQPSANYANQPAPTLPNVDNTSKATPVRSQPVVTSAVETQTLDNDAITVSDALEKNVPTPSTPLIPLESNTEAEVTDDADIGQPLHQQTGWTKVEVNKKRPSDHESPLAEREARSKAVPDERKPQSSTSPDAIQPTASIDVGEEVLDDDHPSMKNRSVEQEPATKLQTSPSSVNRRTERLADTKRGGRSNGDSDQRHSTNPSDDSKALDRPAESVAESKSGEPSTVPSTYAAPLTIDASLAEQSLSASPNTLGGVSEAVPALATGAVSTTSQATGLGIEGAKAAVTSELSIQPGTTILSPSPTSKGTAPISGGASTLTAHQEKRVLQRVLKGLEQLNDGRGQVRLRLHPPELGSMQVTMRVEAQQVSALIEVEHAAAREVLLSNLPQLQSRLADQGLNVAQFEVKVVEANQFSQGNSFGFASSYGQNAGGNEPGTQHTSRYLDRLRNQLDRPSTVDAARPAQSNWTRKNGELDLRV